MKKNFIVDTIIFLGFLVAFEPSLTGETVHEWFSLALAGTLVLHLLLHWDWVINVGVQFFRKLFHSSRLNFVIDLLLLISFVTIILSGIMISRSVVGVLGIEIQASRAWRIWHSTASNLALTLVALHFGLHWKWILNACKRFIRLPFTRRSTPQMSEPATVTVQEEL